MDEIIKKISTYNIFAYLIPGVVFVVLIGRFSNLTILTGELAVDVFIYYFIGFVIGQVGSLLIETTLKKIKLLKFEDYNDYLSASEKDKKIEVLVEQSNMLRNFISMFVVFFAVKICEVLGVTHVYLIIAFIFLLFLLAYIRQTNYISKRIKRNK